MYAYVRTACMRTWVPCVREYGLAYVRACVCAHGNNIESPPNTLTADIFNSYFTNIGLDTLSHLQPTPTTGVDGGENDLFWRGSNSTCCFAFTTIEQDSVKKNLLKSGDVTNNDVLGFDSRMLFLSADIIAPILTKFYNVSVETETVISDGKLLRSPLYIRERVARMKLATIDL